MVLAHKFKFVDTVDIEKQEEHFDDACVPERPETYVEYHDSEIWKDLDTTKFVRNPLTSQSLDR